MSTNYANYADLDMEDLDDELSRCTQQATAANQNQNKKPQSDAQKIFLKVPSEGFLDLRILPRRPGQKLYCATRLHKLEFRNGENVYSRYYHCRRELIDTNWGKKWQGGDCEICNYYSSLWKKSEKPGLSDSEKAAAEDLARKFKPQERFYYNVLARSYKNEEGIIETNAGPYVFSCGIKVHEKILRAIRGDTSIGDKGLGNVTDPINGYDFKLVVKRTKGQAWPNYDLSKFETAPSRLGTDEEIEAILGKLHDLQALRILKTNEELSTALRISLGLERPTSQTSKTFDMSKYESGEDSSDVVETSHVSDVVNEDLVKPNSNVAAKKTTSVADEILADEDFLKELDG